MDYIYRLVLFIDDSSKGNIDIVPTSWLIWNEKLNRMCCKYMPGPFTNKKKCEKLHEMVKKGENPKPSWSQYPVQIRGRACSYEQAEIRLAELEQQPYAFTTDNEKSAKVIAAEDKKKIMMRGLRLNKKKLNDKFQSAAVKLTDTIGKKNYSVDLDIAQRKENKTKIRPKHKNNLKKVHISSSSSESDDMELSSEDYSNPECDNDPDENDNGSAKGFHSNRKKSFIRTDKLKKSKIDDNAVDENIFIQSASEEQTQELPITGNTDSNELYYSSSMNKYNFVDLDIAKRTEKNTKIRPKYKKNLKDVRGSSSSFKSDDVGSDSKDCSNLESGDDLDDNDNESVGSFQSQKRKTSSVRNDRLKRRNIDDNDGIVSTPNNVDNNPP